MSDSRSFSCSTLSTVASALSVSWSSVVIAEDADSVRIRLERWLRLTCPRPRSRRSRSPQSSPRGSASRRRSTIRALFVRTGRNLSDAPLTSR
ncbi:hypothetical protein C8039_02890 [Halogeometricum sp. wsp3]|nr:hypothetical protein C8039_02890 [Halogeometricum sp. wsp3]